MALFIDERIILTNLNLKDNYDVFQVMGKKLFEEGLVTDRFIEEIINREEKYPTGLPTKIPISLCHTDSEHVKQPFLTLATLTNPIPFHEMGNSKNIQDVKIAFFLGIIDKKEHIDFLRKIMTLVRSEDILTSIYRSKSAKQIKKILCKNLL
ncbi:MAG: PTS sugar transporter subunit IIA [Pelolinea sp.]|nr:PTS sugar transporter subunit IIA [Pelolinea sp.]